MKTETLMPTHYIHPRWHAALFAALGGGGFAQAAVLSTADRLSEVYVLMMVPAVLGAGAAGVLFAEFFGRCGWWGAVCALVGWVFTTLVGACGAVLVVIAATQLISPTVPFYLDAEAILFGPAAIVMAVGESVHVIAIWLCWGVLTHLALRQERRAIT